MFLTPTTLCWFLEECMSNIIIEEKVVDLESRIAFQEDVIQQLSDQIAEQQNTMHILTIQLKHLSDQVKAGHFSDGGEHDGSDIPPHY